MSADSVTLPASGNPLPNFDENGISYDAVDTFEITARLEASGLSDRLVRQRHGAADVFAYAQTMVQVRGATRVPHGPRGWLGKGALMEAARRAIILILGAVLGGLTATILSANTREILIAGIGAWVIGQSVSGIVWAYAGAGQLKRGIARGTAATLLVTAVLACYLVVSLLLPGHDGSAAALLMAWCWYSCIVSMLVILGRSRFLLAVLAVGTGVVTLQILLGYRAAPFIVAIVAVSVIVSVTALFIAQQRTIKERRVLNSGDWKAAIPPAAQAGFLAAALSMALTRLPAWEGTALVAATVVAAAATDPALVLMRQRLQWSSQRTPLLRHAARNAWLLTMAISAAIVVISAVVSALVVLFLVEENRVATTIIVAATFSSLATTSTTLNAFGLPRGAVGFAAAASLSAAVWIVVGNLAGLLVALGFLAIGLTVLLTRVADPRTYA
ncbi:hypothetical protein LJ756_03220 [Arthrobacter sp. zg-Y411]|uniref:hypothetical protein n=1 Tax=Arthrobacter zhangbolii TaxID=2886936 RepID=UPI001D137EBE|nr:hypothetical protein [Arthrobacter zhangbolii]MCC3293633.1 hypothetical protein [Arthrobacter zhangbolii]